MLSKKLFKNCIRFASSGPVAGTLTSGPLPSPSKRATCLAIGAPTNSATSLSKLLTSFLNATDCAGLAVSGFRLLKKELSGLVGLVDSPINIIRARSGSGAASIPATSGTTPAGAVSSNSGAAGFSVIILRSGSPIGSVNSNESWLGAVNT